ncbi:glycosyltransferase family 2 protein [Enterococcus gallinarum]|uniref:glycosyltransferase family 2 protein n=1 Tax=Enterococcus gallinarum TaxID=1353 RepID=UPI00288D0648|nr:glycosyltransferase family 2 protein [Enterococcus gallinarum]MDT2699061.1 glycosyltransferase family 2 protein [Enterococcus gallinarum]MDT2722675.1 glycosyltransferase family 2 protein [Enterococcus gallinarum]MDU4931092.1 glycosyltransferase family 2 protein [Enterococcus gallinarum]
MNNLKLSIFTPTFNRADFLEILYISLKEQSNKDFEWIIVDDGSTDRTPEVVDSWINDSNEFSIKYFYTNNGGKHSAYNFFLDYTNTDWHICVDSDDALAKEAIDIIWKDIYKVDNQQSYIGIIYPKKMKEVEQLQWLPDSVKRVNISDIRLKYGCKIETAIVFRQKAIQNYRFPVFDNEKFLSEEIYYNLLISEGQFLPKMDLFYLSEYQENGITKSVFKLWKQNPVGTEVLLESRYNYIVENIIGVRKFVEIVKCLVNLSTVNMIQKRSFFKLSFKPVCSFFLLPLILLNKYYRFEK